MKSRAPLCSGVAAPVLASCLALAACGGDDGADLPDGSTGVDATPTSDAPPSGCHWHEDADADNDDAAEATTLVAGAAPITICGWIDARTPEGVIVDTDRFGFDSGGGPFLVRIDAPSGHGLTALAGSVRSTSQGNALRGDGLFVGDHAVFAVTLEDGAFVVEVVATDDAAPAQPIPYAITITADEPDVRCTPPGGAAAYVEAADGAGNAGNDVVQVVWEPSFATSFTPAETDAPEPSATALVVSSGMRYRVNGAAGVNASAAADDYQDRDTYVLYTGGQTNELTIRLTWDGSDADLDWLLFPVPGAEPPRPISAGTVIADEAPELDTTAVLPSTSYWLWVGSFDGSAEPKPYELTICGETYVP